MPRGQAIMHMQAYHLKMVACRSSLEVHVGQHAKPCPEFEDSTVYLHWNGNYSFAPLSIPVSDELLRTNALIPIAAAAQAPRGVGIREGSEPCQSSRGIVSVSFELRKARRRLFLLLQQHMTMLDGCIPPS